MSGLSSPAASMMSTISVDTRARLTICWMVSSRSAVLLLPSPGTLLTRAARIAWKKPTSSRILLASSLADASAKALDTANTAPAYRRWARFLASSVVSLAASFCCIVRTQSIAPAMVARRICAAAPGARAGRSSKPPAVSGRSMARTTSYCSIRTRTASALSIPVWSRSLPEYWPRALFRFWPTPM